MSPNRSYDLTFVPLHVKSDYSLGYGTASIDELVEWAAALGYRSLALTDLENLYGQVRFHHKCRLHGIRPITGVELRPGFDGRRCPGQRAGRLLLLAVDQDGYRNLCRIVSRRRGAVEDILTAAPGGDPVPVAERFADGLFALSDDLQVVERLVAGGRFKPEMIGLLVVRPQMQSPLYPLYQGEDVLAAASRLGVRIVADSDVSFLQPADHPLHLLQLAIAQGRLVKEVAGGTDAEDRQRWLRPPSDAAALFADLPDALRAASETADACRLELGADEETAHVFNPEAGAQETRQLRHLCEEALAELRREGRAASEEYRRRLDQELAVFGALHFSGFMLIVADILSHCRQHGILGAVRGSAVSSLVLHLLGGSPVDPVANGLLFERFLHAGKSAWPDVDIDLPWDRRDEVIAWVYERFGEDRVAMVAAHHTFRYRSALREGLKAWGVSAPVVESMSRAIPPEDLAVEEVDFLGLAAVAGAGEAKQSHKSYSGGRHPELEEVMSLIQRLVGRPRHIAAHPGGIVIDWRPLEKILPLEMAPKGVVITQYDLVAVAKLGLVKIDLLGNRCLSEIEETLSLAGWPLPLRLASIPAEDPRTLTLIDQAETIGCFQLESPAMRSLLARLPIRCQNDLVAALALIRPGAAAGEVKSAFVRRARGEEKGDIELPVLADRLRETHGLLIYEEDIMVLLSRTGGISLAEADELRRGIVKSGGDPVALSALQERFLTGAAAAPLPNPPPTGEGIGGPHNTFARARRGWTVAARFAAYSFNKAHAASYALLAYYSAYLKVHHPVEFGCALLNHHQGLYPLRSEAAALARAGVELLGPHVNESAYRSECVEKDVSADRKSVRVGLDKVKSLSRRAALDMVQERCRHGRFTDVRNLLDRVRLGVHEATALILCGACDGLAPLDGAAYPFVHEAVVERLRRKSGPGEAEGVLFSVESAPPIMPEVGGAQHVPPTDQTKLYQALVRARNELTYLEMHLSSHPMALLRREAERYRCVSIAEAAHGPADSTVRLAAIVAAMRRVMTWQGPMQFITFEDETGVLEAVVFPVVYRRLGERVTTPGPFLVVGKLKEQQGAVHLEVGRLEPFHERTGKLKESTANPPRPPFAKGGG